MRRNKRQPNPIPYEAVTKSPSNSDAERALDRMLKDFWEVHQKVINKMERCETPSPEEIAEAALNQRLLAEQRRKKREESAKTAKQLLDSIDLEP